jgi:hypothetical protein
LALVRPPETEVFRTKTKMSSLFVKYEEPTIRAFFPPEKRDQYVQLLSKANRRRDALKSFHHDFTFDPKWSKPIDPKSAIVELLKAKGAGPKAYLMGTSKDQRILTLDEAVKCVEHESGILVCNPGQLAYYRGEDGEHCFILERGASLHNW